MIAAASWGPVLPARAADAAELTSGTQSAARTARAAAATGPGVRASAATAASRTRPSRHIDAATTPAGAPPEARTSRQLATVCSGDWPAYGRLADSSRRSHPGPLRPASRAVTSAVLAGSGSVTA
jgi:hypothetical protein